MAGLTYQCRSGFARCPTGFLSARSALFLLQVHSANARRLQLRPLQRKLTRMSNHQSICTSSIRCSAPALDDLYHP